MLYPRFFECLSEMRPSPRVEVMQLAQIVNERHQGVGVVTFRYFQSFPGAQLGNFVWLEEERTSAHDEPFQDAIVFLNSMLHDQRAERRLVAAKELMHVFDEPGQRTATATEFRRLLNDIESMPLLEDASPQYQADRAALWKAILALVPPWQRREYLEQWTLGNIKSAELATRWWLPENIVASAMGSYYEHAAERFGVNIAL